VQRRDNKTENIRKNSTFLEGLIQVLAEFDNESIKIQRLKGKKDVIAAFSLSKMGAE
jgi:hypothetical protein